jgi:excisionase family DNA binding protein
MLHPSATDQGLYRVHQAARLLGLTEPALRQAIARGQVPAHRIGRRVVVRASDLQRLIDGAKGAE